LKHAVAILIEKDGRYLFVQRPSGDLFEGYWSPPTGKLEPGERQDQTVVREAMEELGLSVIPLHKVWDSITSTGEFTLHWWTARSHSFDITPQKEEIAGYQWVHPKEIRSLGKVFDTHIHFFENIDSFLKL